jgi:hypothetical protein
METLNTEPQPTNNRSYFSRTLVYLGGIFALFLISPIPLAAQSGSSEQTPAAQSEEQSAPPCSNAPPIMKRGSEAELPPCPDPPPDDSSPRPPNSSAPLIERARYVAFQFAQKLPNFICEEHIERLGQRGQDKMLIDTVSAEVVYSNGKETYRNIKVNNRPTDKDMMALGGARSTGEFASMLLDLFATNTNAEFRSGGSSPISGYDAQVYDFHVQRENSHWNVEAQSQTLRPAYEGSVWIDPASARVLRIEMQATRLPASFPMATVETAVDYSSVRIAGNSFLLPVHAETMGCERGGPDCSHNIIDFRNYHEFKVDFKIGGVAN